MRWIYQRLPVKHGQVSIVALTHPSLYYANVAHHRFQSYTGIAAEREMIEIAKATVFNEDHGTSGPGQAYQDLSL